MLVHDQARSADKPGDMLEGLNLKVWSSLPSTTVPSTGTTKGEEAAA